MEKKTLSGCEMAPKIKKISIGLLLLPLFFLNYSQTFAQESVLKTPHVKARLISEFSSVKPGQPFTLGLDFEIIPGWHTYWQNPGDSGEPLKVSWVSLSNVTFGPLDFPAPEKIEIPPLANYGYSGSVMFLTDVTPPGDLSPGTSVKIQAKATWLVCEATCIPEEGNFELTLPIKSESPYPNPDWKNHFDQARARIPKAFDSKNVRLSSDSNYLWLHFKREAFPSSNSVPKLTFFPKDQGLIENAAPQELVATSQGPALRLTKNKILTGDPPALTGVIVASSDSNSRLRPPAFWIEARPKVFLWRTKILGFAFLGGLILNLMPCVFPVLSIKILGFLKKSGQSHARVQMHGLAYTLGVLVSFWLLAGIITLVKLGGEQVGWGFQLQSPLFLLILAYLMFVLALSLLGLFQFGTSFLGLGGRFTTGSGLLPTFFTGVLATVVATPCVAPFMGPALGVALTQTNWMSWTIFTALGLGMALPYLFLSFYPGAIRILPKPGAWMETFKQAMAFLLFATILWLLWVFGLQTDFKSILAFLSGLLLLGFGIWWGSRLKAGKSLRHYAGVAMSLLFVLAGIGVGITGIRPNDGITTAPVDVSQEGLEWIRFSPEDLEKYRREGKPVFLNFTAAWCITCQVNERLVFQSKKIREEFLKKDIIAMKADWTNKNQMIARILESYGRQGVPLYVLYGSGPQSQPTLLPEILTPAMVMKELENI